MTALPEVPRWAHTTNANGDYTGMTLYPEGGWVRYERHLTAMQAAQTISSKVIADFQRQARETALREALAVIRDHCLVSDDSDGRDADLYWDWQPVTVIRAIQRLIDGGDTHG